VRRPYRGKENKGRRNSTTVARSIAAAVLSFGLLLSGCGNDSSEITESIMDAVDSSLSGDRGITLYYVDGAAIRSREEKLQPKQPDSVTGCLEEVMGQLTLTDGITFEAYTMGKENAVTLSFHVDEGVSKETALLEKAAVVSTISQIRNIGDITLSTAFGEDAPEEETLKSSSFYYYDNVIPTGQNTGWITLYLPEEEKLAETSLSVTLQLDVSAEEEVVRQLIDRGAFPEGTRLLSVSVIQKVAYVDLSPEFAGATELMVASLVDSVSRLPHISSVQILLDGEKKEEIGGVDTHVPLKFFRPETEEE